MRCKLNSMHNCRVAIQVGWRGARQKSKAQKKWDAEGEKKKVKNTKPDATSFLKPFGIWGSTLQKHEDSEKRDARKQNARRRSGIFWMVYIGLARKFTQVFPLPLMEKPKRTYWLTQYITILQQVWATLGYFKRERSRMCGRERDDACDSGDKAPGPDRTVMWGLRKRKGRDSTEESWTGGLPSGVELESQAGTRGPSERRGSFEEGMELVVDKASPGNCTEIPASYARISGSHKWLVFILSPRNMTVRSVHSRSQRYKPWSKPCHPGPARTVPSDSSWDHSCRVWTRSCRLQPRESDRALRSSRTLREGSSVNEDMTLSHHTRGLFVLLLAYWEEKFKKKKKNCDFWRYLRHN